GERAVLRIDNDTVTDRDREAQHIAMQACTSAGILVPRMIPGTDGKITQRTGQYSARLSEFAEGRTMVDITYFAPKVLREFGSLAARSVLALQHLPADSESVFHREQQWDMRRAHEETERILGAI